MRGKIYRPAAQTNGNIIYLCPEVDSYIYTMCVYMPHCVRMHLYECFSVCTVCTNNSVQSHLNITVCTCFFLLSFFQLNYLFHQHLCPGWWGYQMVVCISLPSHQWASPSSLSTKSKIQLPPCGFHNYTTHQDRDRWGIPMSEES